MHPLGERFGDAIGERLHHDRTVIVIGLGEAIGDLAFLRARGHDEGADIIGLAALAGATKSASARLGLPSRRSNCWRRVWKVAELLRARFARIERDVVADGVGRPEADHGFRVEPVLLDDALQHGLRVVEELRARPRPVSDRRESRDSGPRISQVWKNGVQSI